MVSERAEHVLDSGLVRLTRLLAGERVPLLGVPVAIKDDVDPGRRTDRVRLRRRLPACRHRLGAQLLGPGGSEERLISPVAQLEREEKWVTCRLGG
jgi:Asp-tRNA(Asn)/Glu-tRNA(Gln) amidotransferase A subunit family amidase